MEIIQTKHILMQQVMCLSAVCHITTAPLLLTQHREEHPQRLWSMLTVLSSFTTQLCWSKVGESHCAKIQETLMRKKKSFQYRPTGIGRLFLVCPLEGLSEQETCPHSPQQASFQTSVGKLSILNKHTLCNFCWGKFLKIKFHSSKPFFNKCWVLKAQK